MALCQQIEKSSKVTRIFENLRHYSRNKNIFYTYAKSGVSRSFIKRDIDVKEIKVEKSLKKLPLFFSMNNYFTCNTPIDRETNQAVF